MKTGNSTDTKQLILDVAERHFALYGFAGTSLRGIIKEAGVNVAAIAYHFGEKEEVFRAVIRRFATPVVAEQLRMLSQVDETDLRSVLSAFYLPPLELVKSKGKASATLALFLGRVQTEPEPIFQIVDEQFADCRRRFIEAFRSSLRSPSEADLQWHFEFMLSLIVCFLTRQSEIRRRYSDLSEWKPEEAAKRMVDFCLNGMTH
ncbi:MAG TPA: TetR/AcrR family transcriptional regulator [Chroococcales cyanobacterium]